MNAWFAKIAKFVSAAVGSPIAFMLATGSVIVWGLTGPAFGYSSAWQLVINTGTTIITFLMVFIIQNAQNRDQKALQLKLDELLRASADARTGYVDLENLDDKTLSDLERRFKAMRKRHVSDLDENALDSPVPEDGP